MTLTEDLTKLSAQMQAKLPEEVMALFEQAGRELLTSGMAKQAIKTGDLMPTFTLPNGHQQLISSQNLLKAGPLVISFYRGGWCPYCSLELQALRKALREMQDSGAQLVAISPETPDHSLSTQQINDLGFEVLSDAQNQLARQFGLVFNLPDYLRPVYEQLGIDLQTSNGNSDFELPIPATYVVNTEGIIIHSFVNPDYTQRQNPQDLLPILQNLKTASVPITQS
ncbi:peroxiredoxin-like family protein [Spirulina subsalsa]|uniref:peroxiredoxin-like family protein n=1 Tax=Spirulina subsalsa TaxID=54311 RepID=UPI00030F4734|nr:peroxiredoxin-like family protein [Spirulina subsalsa]